MVKGIGSGAGAVGREAVQAALQRMQQRANAAQPGGAQPAQGPSFVETLKEGVLEVDASVKRTEELPLRVIKGEVDFPEIAAQIKESELSFEFAMQVRNKLIDAYREVMRMGV